MSYHGVFSMHSVQCSYRKPLRVSDSVIANVCLQAVFWGIQACVSSRVLFYGIMVASTKLTIGIFFYPGHTCLEETHIEDAFFLL